MNYLNQRKHLIKIKKSYLKTTTTTEHSEYLNNETIYGIYLLTVTQLGSISLSHTQYFFLIITIFTPDQRP